MKTEAYPVEVIFRKHRDSGEVFAIFPYEIANLSLDVTCYETVGQHGAGDNFTCIEISNPAKPAEYAKLARELESLGYVLTIKQKINAKRMRNILDMFEMRNKRGAK